MDLQTIKKLIRQNKLVKFYQCKAWRTLRHEALKRDNFECQRCKRLGGVTAAPPPTPGHTRGNATPRPRGKNKKSLHVHHLKEVKDYPELALVLDNTETLCQPCHNHPDVHDRLEFNKQKPKFVNEERW